jgi:hypothetical protein
MNCIDLRTQESFDRADSINNGVILMVRLHYLNFVFNDFNSNKMKVSFRHVRIVYEAFAVNFEDQAFY